MLEIHVAAQVGEPTGPLVAEDLIRQGCPTQVRVESSSCRYPPEPITKRVCWGLRGDGGIPELNTNSSRYNKFTQLKQYHEAGVLAPKCWQEPPVRANNYPILGRLYEHRQGRDIKVCASREEALASGSQYFTKLLPSQEEYRVWVFKDKCLGVYDHRLTSPPRREGFGRQCWNGYRHVRLEEDFIHAPLLSLLAAKAVEANRLDFGAVDILHGTDNSFKV
jgi:hypothetical protein